MCQPDCPCTQRIRDLEQRLAAAEDLRCAVACMLMYAEATGTRWRSELRRLREAAVRASEAGLCTAADVVDDETDGFEERE